MQRAALALLACALLGFGCSDHEPRPSEPQDPNPPVENPAFWFEPHSVTVDEEASEVWVTVHRRNAASPQRVSIHTILVDAEPSDFLLFDREAYFPSSDSTADVMFYVRPDSEVEAPEHLWFFIGDSTGTPGALDPRYLAVEIRDLTLSTANASIDLGFLPGRSRQLRVAGQKSGCESPPSEIWGEIVTYDCLEPRILRGEEFFPLIGDPYHVPFKLMLRQDGTILRGAVDADTSSTGYEEFRLLGRHLLSSPPGTLLDLTDPPGTKRTLFNFDTTYVHSLDSSVVRCSISGVMEGRFDVAGPAGIYPGALRASISYDQFVERREYPWQYRLSWTLTMTVADSIGLIRVASSYSDDRFNPANGGIECSSYRFTGNLVP